MNKKILHNTLYKSKNYENNLKIILDNYDLIRNKKFSNASLQKIQKLYPKSELFLTHSATGALEMIAILLNIKKGDEIILPSFTFVASINPFVSRGAKPVFVDINPNDLNIDTSLIEKHITKNTIAILGMHYAGHSCNNNGIQQICKKHKLYYIEDAAMSFGMKDKEKYLGSFGDLAVISFDITKHISAIQGGLLIVNNKKFLKRANNIYHSGTNRNDFYKGKNSYFEWVDIGSKFQMTETNAAILFEQLSNFKEILKIRQNISMLYYKTLKNLETKGFFKLMTKKQIENNAHLFYLILENKEKRDALIKFLNNKNIEAFFHYIPLHSSKIGKKIAFYDSKNDFTTKISNTLLRLPLHTNMSEKDVNYIVENIKEFFKH